MDHDVSALEYPTTSAQESMSIPVDTTSQNTYGMWADSCQTYSLQDGMQWLSHNSQDTGSVDEYMPTLQHSISEPTMVTPRPSSVSRFQSESEMAATPRYPSQIYATSVSPSHVHAAYDALAPHDSNNMVRPHSTETMLDSGSSATSRPSSVNSSPTGRGTKFNVPAIQTQFENKSIPQSLGSTPMGDGIQVAPDLDSMTDMSNEWMQFYNGNHHNLHEQSLSATSIKTTPGLLEPIQLHSPGTRRTSMSSAVSGPVFSPYGTPNSAMYQQSVIHSPYSPYGQQQGWTPVSNMAPWSSSPQSPNQPKKWSTTWNKHQYLRNLRQQNSHVKPAGLTLPSRRPPPIGRMASDSYMAMQGGMNPHLGSRARRLDTRGRVRGESTSLPSSATTPQQSLPEFQLSNLFVDPGIPQLQFQGLAGVHTPTRNVLPSSVTHTPMAPPPTTPRTNITTNFNSFNLHTPIPHLPTNVPSSISPTNPIPTPPHQTPLPAPSEPPQSDFITNSASSAGSTTSTNGHNHSAACGPVRQSPHFEGDIYTPRYKRKNAAGKWEGWCGYCTPGRWLDLKNSRFWEDKLRNHGICARTKTFFDGPVRVRWVNDRGTIWEGEPGDSGFDISNKDGAEEDGIGRKREGFCGECNTWVHMDGMRNRGKGRCVAWWMHAYKCHEQSRSRTDGQRAMQ